MTQADSVYITPPTNTSSIQDSLSRRNMLAGLAAVPAVLLAAVPTMAAAPDPIFALIEAKRAADIAHLAALDVLNKAERRYGVGSDEEQAAYDDSEPACHAAFDTAWSLASTPPTTLAGVLAVLKFVRETDDEGNWPEDMGLDDQLLESMLQAIETIMQRGQS
jgi:hypothetical protein